MKSLCCIICISFLFLTFTLNAQKSIPKFGTVDKSELLMTSCSFEPGAPAMNLFDVMEVELEHFNYPRVITEKRVRIKIFSAEGLKYASISIPYFSVHNSTRIKNFTAIVYNLDEKGNVVTEKVEKEDFYKEKINDKLKSVAFTFPNVKKGSVIEYRYTKIERFINAVDPWIIQDDIPTAYAAMTLTRPERYMLYTKTFGSDSIPYHAEIKNAGGNNPRERRFYVKENIRGFRAEPFMSATTDNQLKMSFNLQNFFFRINDIERYWAYLGHIALTSPYLGQLIRSKIPGTEDIVDSALKIASMDQRVEYLYNRVRQQIPEVSGYNAFTQDLDSAWMMRQGTSAAINLILLNLMNKAGVNSYPLLVSTRDHGRVAMDFPSLGQMNNVDVVAYDTGTVYIMDASIKQSFRLPPLNILNRNAYLLDSGNSKWIYIEDLRTLYASKSRITAQMNKEGMVKGEAVYRLHDYARQQAKDTTTDVQARQLFSSRHIGVKIHSITNENMDRLNDPVVQTVKFDYELNNDGSFFYFNPQFLGLQEKNPFLQKERQTDIDFGCNQKLSTEIILQLPDGFSIVSVPQPVKLRSSDTTMLYSRMVFTDAQTIVFRQEFEIRRPLFFKEEYAIVYQFFEKMFTYLNEELVFKKQ
jgi:hypothetical protein